jgi:FlaA1/EpsC-like NDP-sugar epimerase
MSGSILKDKTVLVTGGTGSIGSELVNQALNSKAKKVLVFSRDEIKHFLMKKRILDPRFETVVGDVRDFTSIERVFRRFDIDVVFHCAAMKHVVMCEDFPEEAVRTNILGTQNVVDCAMRYGVSRMTTISTDKAAGPVNLMGATKFIAERMTLNAARVWGGDRAFCCVRFGNVASSRGSVIPVFIDMILRGNPLQVSDLGVTRFTMEIPQAVSLVMKATECAQGGEVFILKMKAFRLEDLVDVLLNRIAPRMDLRHGKPKLETTGLVRGERLHEDLLNNVELSNVFETHDMYIIQPNDKLSGKYTGAKRASLESYTSAEAQFISKDDIENIIVKYLESIGINL